MLLYEALIVPINTGSATQTLPKLCVALRPSVAALYQPGGATAVDFQELTPTQSAPAAGAPGRRRDPIHRLSHRAVGPGHVGGRPAGRELSARLGGAGRRAAHLPVSAGPERRGAAERGGG
jgi:hypothetical protein